MVTIIGACPYEQDSTESANGAKLAGMGKLGEILREARNATWSFLRKPYGAFAVIVIVVIVLAEIWSKISGSIGILDALWDQPVSLLSIIFVAALFGWAVWANNRHEDKKADEIRAKLAELADQISGKQAALIDQKTQPLLQQAEQIAAVLERSRLSQAAMASQIATDNREALKRLIELQRAFLRLKQLSEKKDSWPKALNREMEEYKRILAQSAALKRPPKPANGADQTAQEAFSFADGEFTRSLDAIERSLREWRLQVRGILSDYSNVLSKKGSWPFPKVTPTEINARQIANEESLTGHNILSDLKQAVAERAQVDELLERANRALAEEIREHQAMLEP